MNTTIRLGRVLAVAVGAVICAPAWAGGGVLEINQDCAAVGCFSGDTAGFPVTITQPGSYALTSDIAVTGDAGSTIGILIQASPTRLDLGGFTVSGGGSCAGSPVNSCAGAQAFRGIQLASSNRLVSIRNGTVRGFGNDGVEMFSATDGTLVEDMTITENGGVGFFASGTVGASIRLDRVALTRNLGGGALHSTNGRLVVNECVFSNNGGHGMSVATRAVVQGSSFLTNDGFGVSCTGLCALGRSAFLDNNSASASNEFSIAALRDMGGNVCDDGTCP